MHGGNDLVLGRRLQAARERAFVGREEELAVFDAALGGGWSVVYVYGPGGVGKSALLRRFAEHAAAIGRAVTTVDGHTLDPVPASFGPRPRRCSVMRARCCSSTPSSASRVWRAGCASGSCPGCRSARWSWWPGACRRT
ncbi:ATP-binding protein [Streptosporangium sp. G11]|uniref:ATP-binding protein n=1 Tax=Streptosporangium sp. G11 TaxID=3436926 RepID=UPI003EBA2C66